MKKILSIILVVVLLVTALPMGAFEFKASAATSGTTGDCTWTLEGTLLTISGNGAMGDNAPWGTSITNVIIEDGVTSIGNDAFYNCSSLTSITIPDSVTSIGAVAFSNCTSLKSITIPNSVTSIGWVAFESCTSLKEVHITDIAAWCNIKFHGSVTYPSNPLDNGGNLYLNGNLITDIVIPNSATSIGNCAFYNCKSLTSITIPDSVTSIGEKAFYGCSNLTSINIPDGVKSIGFYAFSGCSSLTNITLPDSVTLIDMGVFSGCSSLTSITIPDSVTVICSWAFDGCTKLTDVYYNGTSVDRNNISIDSDSYNECLINATWHYATSGTTGDCMWTLEGTLLTISGNGAMGDNAPWGTSITNVIIEDGVTSIGNDAFYNCSSLTSITIPDSVTSIGAVAFSNCTSLKSITIPNSVTSIGWVAFESCTSLKEVHITDIAAWCNIKFHGSVTYPSNPLDNGGNLYLNGNLITDIVIPNSATSIGNCAFYNCKSLTSITIPDSVTSIGEKAFYGCSNLTSINIPDGVKSIGFYAFSGCSSLTNITLPDSVTLIDMGVFSGCSSLTSITIPDSVTVICSWAFDGCTKLTDVYYNGTSVDRNNISIDSDSYNECLINATWHYATSGTTGDCMWTLSCTTLTISGNGAMGDYSFSSSLPWGTSITEVVIEEGVTNIGSCAFNCCGKLQNIVIPDSVTSIGNDAFYNTGYYNNSSNWKNNVLYIGNHLIEANTSISGSYEVKSGTITIADDAFSSCDSLTSITIPDSVTSIGDYAFYNCTSLKTVYYRGSSSDKSKISIGSDNQNLTDATWYYNSCIGSELHTYDNTCDISCNICETIRTIEHTYTSECDRDCNVCGEFRRAPHKYDNACDDTCDLCGTEREVEDHVYSSVCDIDCDECGAIRSGVVHTYDNTCDTVCNLCSAMRTIAHTYTNTCDTTCNVCGETRTITHTYDNDCDANCNVCGELRTPPHRGAGVSCDFANATNYPFSLSGNVYSSTNKYDSSSATATITATGSGRLTIKYYTSTESNYDKLTIKLNSTTKVTASGETAWTTIDIPVVKGDKIYITYSKDGSYSNGSDTVKFEFNSKSQKSCDQPLLCLDCDEILEYPEEHEYDDGCDMECNKCGAIRAGEHLYSNSCDMDCNLCGYIRTVEHTFTNECDGECDICYETRKPPHAYDNACDGECNLCGKTRTVPDHTYGDDLICDECGHKNFVLGDIDGTGVVDLSDVTNIARYFAGWDVDVNESALDVDGDGLVNLNDLIHLAQYVAGWDVELY